MAAYPEHCDVLEGVLNNCCTRTNDVYSALPSKCYQSVSCDANREERKWRFIIDVSLVAVEKLE